MEENRTMKATAKGISPMWTVNIMTQYGKKKTTKNRHWKTEQILKIITTNLNDTSIA